MLKHHPTTELVSEVWHWVSVVLNPEVVKAVKRLPGPMSYHIREALRLYLPVAQNGHSPDDILHMLENEQNGI